jgi:hypothetical protein
MFTFSFGSEFGQPFLLLFFTSIVSYVAGVPGSLEHDEKPDGDPSGPLGSLQPLPDSSGLHQCHRHRSHQRGRLLHRYRTASTLNEWAPVLVLWYGYQIYFHSRQSSRFL